MNEAAWQQQVLDLARVTGWRTAHFRPARTAHGWRTPVAADGAGFPDLVLAKPGQPVIFAEMKTDRGRLTPEQEAWIAVLDAATGCEAHAWRPRDFELVHAALRRGRRREAA